MNNNYYRMGSYNIICDRCGQKYKRDQCKKEWTGLLTCFNCFDPRHPVTVPLPTAVDSKPVPDSRSRPRPLYVTPPAGLSIWGVIYEGSQGLDPNLTWNNWTTTWDGNANPDDFILGD